MKDKRERKLRMGVFDKMIKQMKENAAKAREHAETHCGVCAHDCSLKNPGCNVGVEAAQRKAARDERRRKRDERRREESERKEK